MGKLASEGEIKTLGLLYCSHYSEYIYIYNIYILYIYILQNANCVISVIPHESNALIFEPKAAITQYEVNQEN